jgi:hypothetical protein
MKHSSGSSTLQNQRSETKRGDGYLRFPGACDVVERDLALRIDFAFLVSSMVSGFGGMATHFDVQNVC